MTTPAAPRRWFRFSLRTLFALVTACGIGTAVIASRSFVVWLAAAGMLSVLLAFASFVGLAWLAEYLTDRK